MTCVFDAILAYRVSSRPTSTTQCDPFSKQTNEQPSNHNSPSEIPEINSHSPPQKIAVGKQKVEDLYTTGGTMAWWRAYEDLFGSSLKLQYRMIKNSWILLIGIYSKTGNRDY